MEEKLICAVQQGDLQLAKKLLLEGANVNEQDEQGWTALHWSAGSGNVGIVRLLLDYHANITIKGHDNRTPWAVARAANRDPVLEILTQAEKAASVWKDPQEGRPYCKGYYLKDLVSYPHWPSVAGGNGSTNSHDVIVYLHQDFTVTKSVWPGEDVIFSDVTPEWVQFCESQLSFSIPADLL